MNRATVERRLTSVSTRLRRLREELALLDEERQVVAADAEDARVRALVSETPLADRQAVDARRHIDTLDRRHRELVAERDRLERAQDDLLDQLGN
jgi:hypothetical protein